MENVIIWFMFMFVDLSMVVIAYKLFGKMGLYGMIVMSIIAANIQVLKIVEMFGMTTTLGNVLYGSIFLTTDMLSEFYGKKSATKGVWLGFFTFILFTFYMQVALIFTPHAEDFAQPFLIGIFSLVPRIALASMIAYLVSQHHDVWAFHFWKKKTHGKKLWLRNNASTLVSQMIDSIIFCSIAFWGVFSMDIFLQILATTYFIKMIVAIIDTPFIYYAKKYITPNN